MEGYPIGASNQTYITLFSHSLPSSSGNLTPHFKSRVMLLLFNPPFNHPSVKAFPFELQCPFALVSRTNFSTWGCSSCSFRFRCAVVRSAGVDPHAEQRGLMSSRGDSYVPEQRSHWSPRASVAPQPGLGQVPST